MCTDCEVIALNPVSTHASTPWEGDCRNTIGMIACLRSHEYMSGNSGSGQMLASSSRTSSIGTANRAVGRAIAAALEAMPDATLAGGVDMEGDVAALAQAAEVLVDFSSLASLSTNLSAARAAGKPVVIGTTGLTPEHHALIDEAAREIAVLQTGNTSLGVTLLAVLVEQAAARLAETYSATSSGPSGSSVTEAMLHSSSARRSAKPGRAARTQAEM